MICPRCGTEQPQSAECVRCGVLVAKYAARMAAPGPSTPAAAPPQRSADPSPAPSGQGQATASAAPSVRAATAPQPPLSHPPAPHPPAPHLPAPWLSAPQRQVLFSDLERLLRAHVPLPEALALAGAAVSPAAGRAGQRLGEALQAGGQLEAEVRRYPGFFDPVERALLITALQAGDLPAMCARLAARQRHASLAGDRLRAGLVYPALIIASSAVLTPLPLAFSQGVGAFLAAAGLRLGLLVAAGVGGMAVVRRLQRSESLWLLWSAAAQLPLLRRLVFARRWSLFLDVLALALQAGVPLTQALPLAGAATGEPQGVQVAAEVARKLAQQPLSAAVVGAPGLPARLPGALASAERSGFLADTCADLAAETQQRYLRYVATLVAVLRAAAMAAVALWVAWSLVQQLSGLIADPLGALPGAEGEELRRELQRAMPSLRP